jgi:hypothetical protein
MVQSIFVFGEFERPGATLKKLSPKSAPLQFGKCIPDSLCRLLSRFGSMRLGQDKMNRRDFVMKHKTAHHRQIFLLKFARPPPTAIRAEAKFTSEVWDYPVNVPTARQDRNARMATV